MRRNYSWNELGLGEKILILTSVLTSAVILSNCGKTEIAEHPAPAAQPAPPPAPPPVPTTRCAGGEFYLAGGCVRAPSFETACVSTHYNYEIGTLIIVGAQEYCAWSYNNHCEDVSGNPVTCPSVTYPTTPCTNSGYSYGYEYSYDYRYNYDTYYNYQLSIGVVPAPPPVPSECRRHRHHHHY